MKHFRGRGGRSGRGGGRRGSRLCGYRGGGKNKRGSGRHQTSRTVQPAIQVVEVVGVRYLVAKEGTALRRLPPAAQKAAGSAAAT